VRLTNSVHRVKLGASDGEGGVQGEGGVFLPSEINNLRSPKISDILVLVTQCLHRSI
jgi:hypothetical protein